MYKLIAEQPILLTVVLGLVGVALLYGWTREGRRWLAVAGLIVLALIPLAWLSSSLLVTDEEEIRTMISDMAKNIEANNHDAVYAIIHRNRPDIVARAKSELPNYEFSRARVGGFNKIRILPGTNPKEAVVDLTASVTVSIKNGFLQNQSGARKLLLHLRETDDGWKVIDYSHRQVIGGDDPYTSGGGDWENYLNSGQ